MNKKQNIALWVLLIVLISIVAIFAVLVWPTKYKYIPYEGEYGGYVALRINRFSGEAEGLNIHVGWKKIKKPRVLPSSFNKETGVLDSLSDVPEKD